MNYLIHTFGCQMNLSDAEVLAGHLERLGYQETETESLADVILLITCCVREHAESRVYGKIGELYKLKQERPEIILGIGGCMPQQSEVAEKLRQRFPYLDLVFGTHNLATFPELFSQAKNSKETVVMVYDESRAVVDNIPRVRRDNLKAWVTIMHGCTNFCTYCIVPYVRGKERSRAMASVIAEVEELAARGYREVTLLGQNVNSYGQDLVEQPSFADLLRSLEDIPGVQRVRFMTSHPKDFSKELVAAIASSHKVCEHIHLPIQSGSDKMLSAMNRGYTRDEYLLLVDRIRQEIPEAVLTTDIIVGFPGETEQDFADTLDLLREVRFDGAFTFAYSPRSGTVAAEWPEELSKEDKGSRLRIVNELVNQVALERNQQLVDQVLEVLVEGVSKTDSSMLTGRTRGNKLVHFPGGLSQIGELLSVKVSRAQTFCLFGESIARG